MREEGGRVYVVTNRATCTRSGNSTPGIPATTNAQLDGNFLTFSEEVLGVCLCQARKMQAPYFMALSNYGGAKGFVDQIDALYPVTLEKLYVK